MRSPKVQSSERNWRTLSDSALKHFLGVLILGYFDIYNVLSKSSNFSIAQCQNRLQQNFQEVRSTLADTTKAFEELKEQEPTWQESVLDLPKPCQAFLFFTLTGFPIPFPVTSNPLNICIDLYILLPSFY